jgi:putative ABC transport system permease protein
MATLLQDLRYAVRSLRKSPGFSAVAIATLALGLGANTAIYGWVRATVLSPLPGIPRAGELVVVETRTPAATPIDSSWADYEDLRDQARSFDGLIAFQDRHVTLTERGIARRLYALFVSGNYFDVLGVRTVLGRSFLPEEGHVPGGAPVALIGYGFWGSHFDFDPHAIGKVIHVNDQDLTVVGVTAPEFKGTTSGLNYEVYLPLAITGRLGGEVGGDRARLVGNRTNRWLHLMGRMHTGVSISQARSELETLAARLGSAYPDSNRGLSFVVVPIWKASFGAAHLLAPVIVALFGAVGLVLLIACSNVANLMLVRASERRREIAVRLALGATRARLIRLLVTESAVLSLAGAAAGFLLVPYVNALFGGLLPRSHPLPIALEPPFDLGLFAFGVAVSLAAGVLFGLVPALQASRPNLEADLRGGSATGSGRPQRERRLLVLAQLALAMLLLTATGLFLRSLQNAAAIDPGFDRANVLIVGFDFPASLDRTHTVPFYRSLLERVRRLPGVVAASYGNHVPLWVEGGDWEEVRVAAYQPGADENMKIDTMLVWPGYFSLMRMPLNAGRDFTEHDDVDAALVAIVNEEFASRYFGGKPAVGSRIHIMGDDALVVGVTRTAKFRSLTEAPRPFVYLPQLQTLPPGTALHVRVAPGTPFGATLAAIHREVRAIDPRVATPDGRLDELSGSSVLPQVLGARLLGALGIVALLIASIGVYGVMAYSVSRRRREIGIRLAIGARPAEVRRMILREGTRLTAIGLVLGIVGALAVTRVLTSVLIEVRPDDPIALAVAFLLLGIAALAACSIPALRASRIDPAIALRSE